MDSDELEPKPKKPDLKNLEILSIEALNEYVRELEDEIDRAKNEIQAKELARKGAESIFKS